MGPCQEIVQGEEKLTYVGSLLAGHRSNLLSKMIGDKKISLPSLTETTVSTHLGKHEFLNE